MASFNFDNWPTSVAEARVLQDALRGRVCVVDDPAAPCRVAGVDVGFRSGGRVAHAAVVVLDFPGLAVVDEATASEPVRFPYVPGYLSFREVPVIATAIEKLGVRPEVILCDGQGVAHPRRFGLACHLGVALDIATVGVAKSRLIGQPQGRLSEAKGSHVPLMDRGEVVGAVLRTRAGAKPIYVSVGHRVSLTAAIALVLACCPRYRLPETTRRAHQLASKRS